MSKKNLNKNAHPFHLVDPSPWPFMGSLGALAATFGAVMWFHDYTGGGFLLSLGLIIIVSVMAMWWRDIIRENSFEGHQSFKVEGGMRAGMALFITSEILFFFAFFWGFFYSSINPELTLGTVWPPVGVTVFDAWEVPLINTIILLLSGASITACHNSMIDGERRWSLFFLIYTIFLAVGFTGLQVYEYLHASFDISDGSYGACFFMATGFHGFHVFVGTCFLTVCGYRIYSFQYTRENHFGFEAAAWYWHFVDVVWLFLFVAVYWWGGK